MMGSDGATGGEARGAARGGAGRVRRDAARERERLGPRPRGGEDRGAMVSRLRVGSSDTNGLLSTTALNLNRTRRCACGGF